MELQVKQCSVCLHSRLDLAAATRLSAWVVALVQVILSIIPSLTAGPGRGHTAVAGRGHTAVCLGCCTYQGNIIYNTSTDRWTWPRPALAVWPSARVVALVQVILSIIPSLTAGPSRGHTAGPGRGHTAVCLGCCTRPGNVIYDNFTDHWTWPRPHGCLPGMLHSSR